MVDIRIAVGILALALSVDAQTACETCTTTYGNAKTTAGSDNAALCTALKTYLGCLETALTGASPCVLATSTLADAINTDFTAISATCTLTDSCTCQKDFFKTHLTSTGNADCTAAKQRIACLKGNTGVGCGGTKTTSTLATATETYIGTVSGCATGIASTTACYCELNLAKATGIDVAATKCTKYKEYVDCLIDKTTGQCSASDTVVSLASAAKTALSGIGETNCPLINTGCYCDAVYAMSDISSATLKCSAQQVAISCLNFRTGGNACGGSTVAVRAAAISTAMTTASCSSTATCTCETNYGKVTRTCATATTLQTCVDAVSTTTEYGCDGNTPNSLARIYAKGLKEAACGASEIRAGIILSLLSLAISYL